MVCSMLGMLVASGHAEKFSFGNAVELIVAIAALAKSEFMRSAALTTQTSSDWCRPPCSAVSSPIFSSSSE